MISSKGFHTPIGALDLLTMLKAPLSINFSVLYDVEIGSSCCIISVENFRTMTLYVCMYNIFMMLMFMIVPQSGRGDSARAGLLAVGLPQV